MFKFRSGTHGLNEELGRHRGKKGKTECILCSAKCESVAKYCENVLLTMIVGMHLWKNLLGESLEHFKSMGIVERSSFACRL